MKHRRTGQYHTLPYAGAVGAVGISQNYIYALPFHVPITQSFDRIAIHVATEVTGGAIRLGIYNDNGDCYPSSLLLDAGLVNTTTTGLKEIVINVTLSPGLYWLVLLAAVLGNFLGGHSAYYLPVGRTGPYATGYNCWSISYNFNPFPSTFPAGATLTTLREVIALRRA